MGASSGSIAVRRSRDGGDGALPTCRSRVRVDGEYAVCAPAVMDTDTNNSDRAIRMLVDAGSGPCYVQIDNVD